MLRGEAKKKYQREYMKKQRSNSEPKITDGSNIKTEGLTHPDIMDKLTDLVWRDKLEKICHAFKVSHHPSYNEDVWLGDTNLSIACDYLECTR